MLPFSVLLSVYYKEKPVYLAQALDSILTQSILPNEIVIVKDGPLSKELEEVLDLYAAKHPIFKLVIHQKNLGLGISLRDGVLACANEFIARMDTDDIAMPDRFEKQLSYLIDHPEVSLVGSFVEEFSKSPDHPDSLTKLPVTHAEIVHFAKRRNPFRHMTVMFKKSVVLKAGNYRHFLWFEDYDLWIRMLQSGTIAANLPEVLVKVRADKEMFARRGGFTYLVQDVKFQNFLLNSNFISWYTYATNVVLRVAVRLFPNRLRALIYKNFLRDKN